MLYYFKAKGGPYIGPHGGRWADPQHTIPWHDQGELFGRHEHGGKQGQLALDDHKRPAATATPPTKKNPEPKVGDTFHYGKDRRPFRVIKEQGNSVWVQGTEKNARRILVPKSTLVDQVDKWQIAKGGQFVIGQPFRKGADVDALIAKVMRESGVDKGSAIAILKSKGVIRQDGAHLVRA